MNSIVKPIQNDNINTILLAWNSQFLFGHDIILTTASHMHATL